LASSALQKSPFRNTIFSIANSLKKYVTFYSIIA